MKKTNLKNNHYSIIFFTLGLLFYLFHWLHINETLLQQSINLSHMVNNSLGYSNNNFLQNSFEKIREVNGFTVLTDKDFPNFRLNSIFFLISNLIIITILILKVVKKMDNPLLNLFSKILIVISIIYPIYFISYFSNQMFSELLSYSFVIFIPILTTIITFLIELNVINLEKIKSLNSEI